jgi:hypothetical protein
MPLAEFVKWVVSNPLYGFAMLVGMALGIFYGFDGWRGSADEVDLKDSPRVRNLIWILTAALTTIIGDVKAIDSSASKPLLLLIYCAAVLGGAFVVVILWGIVVAIDSFGARRQLGNRYGTMEAVGDYFFFGYRRYRERKQRHSGERSFLRSYLVQLANSIAAAGAEAPDTQRIEFIRNILRSMTAVVLEYRGGEALGTIRCNLMIAKACTAEMARQLRFTATDATVEECLVLVTYQNDDVMDVILPLPNDRRRESALPGAPAAFVANGPVVIDDTSKIEMPDDLSEEQKTEFGAYFDAKRSVFKSFASLCIVGRGRALGVVNVDCTEEFVFGRDAIQKDEVISYLLPFCTALGIILSR